MEVKLVRLIDGSDVVAAVESFGDPLVLKHVAQIAMQQDEKTGQVSLGLVPVHPLMKGDELTIERSKVVFLADLDDDFRNRFAARHGGIVVPTNGSVLGP